MNMSSHSPGSHVRVYASGAATDREEFDRVVTEDLAFVRACLDEVQDMPVDTFEDTVRRMARFVKLMGRDITQVRIDMGGFK